MKFLAKAIIGSVGIVGGLMALGYVARKEEESKFVEKAMANWKASTKKLMPTSEDENSNSKKNVLEQVDVPSEKIKEVSHDDSTLTVSLPFTQDEWENFPKEKKEEVLCAISKIVQTVQTENMNTEERA